jgi:predicted AAA+ superfamily ATPase
MDRIYKTYGRLLAGTDLGFTRYLYDQINWDNKLIVIKGAKGVGKTTMLLQHIKLSEAESSSLYISADNIYFTGNSLYDVASKFHKLNGKFLYIDEVHKYRNWSTEVKMMYDNLPDLHIVVTGSSVLDIAKGAEADLSRRAIVYNLEGMSFREYLNFTCGIEIRPYSLNEIVTHSYALPENIPHPIPLWMDYLKVGYFPFFREDDFYTRLDNVVNQTLEVDIPTYANMNISTSAKLKRLLYIIARSVPFKPNVTEIARAIGADRGSVADYFVYMEKAGLISRLRHADDKMALLEKIDKIYLSNPTLCCSQSDGKPDVGNLRETAFLSLMRVNNRVASSPVSDFLIDGMTFEVGGKNKKKKQIETVENGFVVKDDIEHGFLNTIPLWAFGLNY